MKIKPIIYIVILLGALSLAAISYAQSMSLPTILGFMTTSGCPGSSYYCWKPYSVSNPLPTSSQ